MINLKSKINALQFSVLLSLSLLCGVSLLPNSFSCFSMIISVIISFLLQIPSLVAFRNSDLPIPTFFKVVTAVFSILISVRLINTFSDFFVTSINPTQSRIYISILISLALIYPSLKGIESISRGSIIGGFFSLISLILIMFCVPYTDMSTFSDRESTLKITDGLNLLFVFAPLVVSFAFNKNYKGKKLRANLLPFAIVSLVIALLMCFVKLLNISEYSYPLYTLSKISFKMIPMGLSGLFLVLSLTCIFFGILYFNLAVKNIMDNHSKVMSLIFIFAVMIVSVLTIAMPNVGKIILNNYFLLILYLIIINLKIITDGIVIKDDSLMLITDTGKKPTIYKSPYRNFNGAVKEIKKKYDLTPFLSHSKVVVISAEITVNELAHYIEELKKYYQVPPDIKVALAENETIEKIEQGKLRIKEVNIYIKNSFKDDSRICTYENNLLGQKFPLLYESDGNVNIKRITI